MVYENLSTDEERALYGVRDAEVRNCRFEGAADGESALKEASGIRVSGCFFDLRYPLWHVTGGEVRNCVMTENCRAALWYDRNIVIEGCRLDGIKALRECENVTVRNTEVSSPELFWKCRSVTVQDVSVVQSEYPFFELAGAEIDGLSLKGKYSFQYASDVEISNSVLDTKDAFWHARNVTVRDSTVKGEYLGWYSEKLVLIRCRIVGTQPFCYCRNLVLEDCTMEGCDLSFERSSVDAVVRGRIDSVKNPECGRIVADEIGSVIMEPAYADAGRTVIQAGRVEV